MTGWPYFGCVGANSNRASRPRRGVIRSVFLAVCRGIHSWIGKHSAVSPTQESGPGASEGASRMAGIHSGYSGALDPGPGRAFGGYEGGGGSVGASDVQELAIQRELAAEKERRRRADLDEQRSRIAIAKTIRDINKLHEGYLKRAKEKLDIGYEG